MFKGRRRRKQLGRVQFGDGSRLADYGIRHLFTRSLFFAELVEHPESPRGGQVYAVDVRHLADEISVGGTGEGLAEGFEEEFGDPPAALYRDGIQTHRSNLPATFPVPGGVIEVAVSMYGLKRMHYVTDSGSERVLQPHRRSHEGLRARFERRFRRLSSVIGGAAVVVLLLGLVVGVPQVVEVLSQIDVVAERIGTFSSPIRLPGWANVSLLVAGILAALERALTLRNHWLVDVDTSWSALG